MSYWHSSINLDGSGRPVLPARALTIGRCSAENLVTGRHLHGTDLTPRLRLPTYWLLSGRKVSLCPGDLGDPDTTGRPEGYEDNITVDARNGTR